MAEWRRNYSQDESTSTGDRPILLLPFRADDALVPGQSRDLILKEGRLFDLVQDAMDDHDSVIGAALLGEDGFLDVLSLCEIHHFEVHPGYRGKVTVSITLKAVGRAGITSMTEMKPIMRGYCQEIVDNVICDVSLASGIVDDIEAVVEDLSRRKDWHMQRQLYEKAYTLTLESLDQAFHPKDQIDGDRRVGDIIAASWAIFAVVSDKTILQKAMKIVDLVERLRFGLKAVLAEKYVMKPTNSLNDIDVGFE